MDFGARRDNRRLVSAMILGKPDSHGPEMLAANPVHHDDGTKSGRKDWAIIHYVAQVYQHLTYSFVPKILTTISGSLLGYLVAH